MRELPVTLSDDADYVLVHPVGSIEATVPSDYDPAKANLIVDLPESLEAPVNAGDKVGTITLEYEGVSYGTLDMVVSDSVARSDFQYYLQVVQTYWAKWWVKALVIAFAVLVLVLVFYMTLLRPRHRRSSRRTYAGASRGGYRGRR